MVTSIWLSGALLAGIALLIVLSGRVSDLKRRVDALDRKTALLAKYPALEKELSTWQKLALDPSSKIPAIKAYQDETGAGLAEAKDAVEKWMKAP